MIEVYAGSWHSRKFVGVLKKTEGFGYVMYFETGKTKKEAMKNTAKALRQLARDCDAKAKEYES